MRGLPAADWAYRSSAVHRRDPRVKVAMLLAVLVAVTTAAKANWLVPALFAVALLAAAPVCNLPVVAVALRALTISLFAVPFAAMLALDGDAAHALALWGRAFACAAGVLLLAGTTRLPDLMAALRWFRMPALLVEVIQFVYRYVFITAGQAYRMRTAAAARGGLSFPAAGGVLAVLFARSYQRAENIHRAMLSRGYSGSLAHAQPRGASAADAVFALTIAAGAAAIRFGAPYLV